MTNGQANQEMVELVERLRQLAEHNREHFPLTREPGFLALGDEAAAAIETLLKQQEELRALISEESIGAMADDIAGAIVDARRRDIVTTRHSAMVRLGARLRKPLSSDLRRIASLTKPALEDKSQPEQQGGGRA